MQIEVSNIVFVGDPPKPGLDRLLAVFSVTIKTDFDFSAGSTPEFVHISDFRYSLQPDGTGYVSVPAIKTKRGIIRPVSVTPPIKQMILTAFLKAWEDLPRPPGIGA